MNACSKLGTMYQIGDGVEKNPEKAAILFRKACDGIRNLPDVGFKPNLFVGCLAGCNSLGLLHLKGEVVSKNIKEARRLWMLACKYGNKDACENLGVLERMKK
jgi:TPR repeat protein